MSKSLVGTLSFAATATLVIVLTQHGPPMLPLSLATLSVVPLAVSTSSFSFLFFRASLGRGEGARPMQSVSTASYLVSGPAAATAFMMQFTALVPPTLFWISASTTFLFFGSALFFYIGLEHSDEERRSAIPVRPFSNV